MSFEKLALSHRKEIQRYPNSMKTDVSVIHNTEKVIRHLLGKKPKGLYALMRRRESRRNKSTSTSTKKLK